MSSAGLSTQSAARCWTATICAPILKMITDTVENAVDISVSDDQNSDKWDLQELNNLLLPVIP